MAVRILGTVDAVTEADGPIALGRKERIVLGLLAVGYGEAVSEGRLIDALWGDVPPPTATKTLRSYVSRLRRALGTTVIVGDPSGYRLDVDHAEIDTWVVEELLRMAAAAGGAQQHAIAAALCRDALATWRGPSLGDLADEPWAAADAARLEELRIGALEARIHADLECGRHLELVGELESLTATHPYRERLWAQRIVALYRSNRQADALRVFGDLRHILTEELGLDPSPELRELEARVLRHDPSLLLEPPAKADTPRSSVAPPTGVVTFLLTDVVGSTRIWEQAPARMADAMARHDHLVQVAVENANGLMLKTRGEGDSTFSVFARTSDAARAAVELQTSLSDTDLSVRVAIHVGQAVERDGDYYGPPVNRAARLRAIAEGGEILLSRSAAELILDEPTAACVIEEVGERQLKDLSRPEQVYRIVLGGDAKAEADATVRRSEPEHVDLDLELPLPLPLRSRGEHVAREAELQTLLEGFAAVEAGGRRGIFIAGEPGMGKTWLAAALARRAHDAGALVLLGRCDDQLRVPFQPLAEALRPLIDASSPKAVASLRNAGELTRLAPEAPSLRGLATPVRDDEDTEQLALAEAVAELLEHVSRRQPVVLVVDDLHWATAPLLRILRHVVRSERDLRLFVVATYRHTELDRAHALSSMLADLRRDHGADRLLLRGLDVEATRALVQETVADRDGAFVAALHDETGGNPFFVTEVMRHLEESHGDRSIPESVREVLTRRFDELSDDANRLLTAAAVLAPSFRPRMLQAIPDLASTPEAFLDAVDEILRAGLLVDDGGVLGFAHALIRQTLLDELSTARRVRLHRIIGESLEVMPDADADIDLLVHHFIEAAVDGHPQRAAHHATTAAKRAITVGAYEHAYSIATRALEALAACGVDDPQLCVPLLVVTANVSAGIAGTTEHDHRALSAEILEAALRDGSPALLVSALDVRMGTMDEGDELIVRATERLAAHRDELDDEALAMLLLVESARLYSPTDDGPASELLDRALAIAPPSAPVHTRLLESKTFRDSNRPAPERLVAAADEVEAMPPESVDFWGRNAVMGMRAVAGLQMADPDAFARVCAATEERYRRSGGGWVYERTYWITRAATALFAADWDAIEALCEELLSKQDGAEWTTYSWTILQFMRHRDTGRTAEILAPFEVMAGAIDEDDEAALAYRTGLALLLAEIGRTSESRSILEGLVDDVVARRYSGTGVLCLFLASAATVTIGDPDLARALLPHLAEWSGLLVLANGGGAVLGAADEPLSGLLRLVGDHAGAVVAARRALEVATRITALPFMARAQVALGLAQVGADDPAGPGTLAEAAGLADRIGMPALAAAARGVLA